MQRRGAESSARINEITSAAYLHAIALASIRSSRGRADSDPHRVTAIQRRLHENLDAPVVARNIRSRPYSKDHRRSIVSNLTDPRGQRSVSIDCGKDGPKKQ
jgi:hypothetical protein